MKINKNTKKILTILAVSVSVAVTAILLFYYTMYNPSSGNGTYYSQQGDGKYLQFFGNNTFSYVYDPARDNSKNSSATNTEEILGKGTWQKQGNKITVKFDGSDSSIVFIEKDEYIYREDTVFRGITSDSKLLNNRYLWEESEEQKSAVWFLNDGTMSYDFYWGDNKTSKWGTYVRTGDILIARYGDSPDIAHRFLVLDKGISQDIYSKTEVK